MQHRFHNLMFHWIERPKAHQKSLSVLLALSLFSQCLPATEPQLPPVSAGGFALGQNYANPGEGELGGPDDPNAPDAATKNAIMQLPSVKGAVSAIGRLNQAMETAAKNPNDEWRREEVRKAMREVPPAVQSLAGSFSSHMIGTSSLPFVLSMLGGFVDVNAPSSFDKFLKNPSADLIPQVGKDFPKGDYSKEDVSLVLNEASLKETSTVYKAPVAQHALSTPVPTIANLKQDTAKLESFEKPSEPAIERELASPASSFESSQAVPLSTPVEESSNLVKQLGADISQAEKIVKELEALKEEEESLFKKKKAKTKKEKEARRPLGPVSSVEATLIYLAENVLSKDAFAQTAGTGSNMGGGPASNPQDGNGGGAGQFLFGAAAIIAAISPMIVANTEAQKEQNITQIETQAQIKQAEIQTQTQKEMAQLSAQTSLAQAKAQQDIAMLNNNAQSERLQLNLAAAQAQRNEERQAQTQQLMMQQQMEAQRVALAQAQANETIRLARQNLEAQRLEAALNDTGMAPSNLPTGALAAGNSTGSFLTMGNPLASALTAQALGNNLGSSSAAATGNSGVMTTPARAIKRTAATPSALLASAVASEDEEFSFFPQLKKKRAINKRRKGPISNSRGIYRNGLSLAAAGSFREQKRALRGRDLTEFTRSGGSPLREGFEYRRRSPLRSISSTH